MAVCGHAKAQSETLHIAGKILSVNSDGAIILYGETPFHLTHIAFVLGVSRANGGATDTTTGETFRVYSGDIRLTGKTYTYMSESGEQKTIVVAEEVSKSAPTATPPPQIGRGTSLDRRH